MEKEDIVKYFSNILEKEKDVSPGMAAIMTLLEVLKHDKSETVQGLSVNLKEASEALQNTDYPMPAVVSSCELFMRYITFTDLEHSFEVLKQIMVKRAEDFLKKHQQSRSKITEHFIDYIQDGARILTHGKSRVVLQAMLEAAKANKRFKVFVTSSALDNSGFEMYTALEEASIDCTLILDSAIGYVMEQVKMVVVGADAVAMSGGIINKIGTLTMAMCAKEMNKAFYVLAESFKFVKDFPIDQQSVGDNYKYPASKLQSNLSKEHPRVDYTPPTYIKQLFTDLGILTPPSVCVEVLKMYQ